MVKRQPRIKPENPLPSGRSSDELEILEDEPRRKTKKTKVKVIEPPQPAEESDSLLDGFGDLEGVTEQEKANLKLAILASRQEAGTPAWQNLAETSTSNQCGSKHSTNKWQVVPQERGAREESSAEPPKAARYDGTFEDMDNSSESDDDDSRTKTEDAHVFRETNSEELMVVQLEVGGDEELEASGAAWAGQGGGRDVRVRGIKCHDNEDVKDDRVVRHHSREKEEVGLSVRKPPRRVKGSRHGDNTGSMHSDDKGSMYGDKGEGLNLVTNERGTANKELDHKSSEADVVDAGRAGRRHQRHAAPRDMADIVKSVQSGGGGAGNIEGQQVGAWRGRRKLDSKVNKIIEGSVDVIDSETDSGVRDTGEGGNTSESREEEWKGGAYGLSGRSKHQRRVIDRRVHTECAVEDSSGSTSDGREGEGKGGADGFSGRSNSQRHVIDRRVHTECVMDALDEHIGRGGWSVEMGTETGAISRSRAGTHKDSKKIKEEAHNSSMEVEDGVSEDDCLAGDSGLDEDEVEVKKIKQTTVEPAVSTTDVDSDEETQPPEIIEEQEEEVDEEALLDLSKSTVVDDDDGADDGMYTQSTATDVDKSIDEVMSVDNEKGVDEDKHRIDERNADEDMGVHEQGVAEDKNLDDERNFVEDMGVNDEKSVKKGMSLDDERGGDVEELQEKKGKVPENCVGLIRHYNNVQWKCIGGVRKVRPEIMDPLTYMNLIQQNLADYARRLYEAQKALSSKLEWGQPVKSGQHFSCTIDAKKRGDVSPYFDFSEEEDDRKAFSEEELNQGQSSWVPRRATEQRECEPEDGMFGLKTRRGQRHKHRDDGILDAILAADTQKFDFESVKLNDNRTITKRLGMKTSRNNSSREAREKDDGTFCLEGKHLSDKENQDTNSSPLTSNKSKRRCLSKRKKVPTLVPDSQEGSDDDFTSEVKLPRLQLVVEETEEQDDSDWLSLKSHDIEKKPHLAYKRTIARLKGPRDRPATSDVRDDPLSDQVKSSDCIDTNQPVRRVRKKGKKAEKEFVAVQVEETQDMDVVELGNKGKRIKRKCFKLEDDSDEEVESIPETQDCDSAPLEEPVKDDGKSGFFQSTLNTVGNVMKKVRDVLSPGKHTGSGSSEVKDRNRNNLDASNRVDKKVEPVFDDLQKQTDTRVVVAGKKNLDKIYEETEEFETLAARSTKERIRRKVVEHCESSGAQRFLQRPVSKESNASDDVSVASSQSSITMLDEKGNLYCTQPCLVRGGRVRSRRRIEQSDLFEDQNEDSKQAEMKEILKLDDSDSDGEVTFNKHVSHHGPKLNKLVSKVFKSQVNLEASSGHDKNLEEDPFKFFNEIIKADKKGISEMKLEQKHRERNISSQSRRKCNTADAMQSNTVPLHSERTSRQMGHLKDGRSDVSNIVEIDDDDEENSNPPISLGQFHTDGVSEDYKLGTRKFPAVKPVVQNVEASKRKRVNYYMIRDDPQEEEGESDDRRSVVRNKRTRTMPPPRCQVIETPQEKVKLVSCPLCDVKFLETVVEEHAATCQGPDQGEEMDKFVEEMRGCPGGSGEMTQCYICDERLEGGDVFDAHLKECMNRAIEQQQQVDAKGFKAISAPPAVEDSPARLTRRRGRAQGEPSMVAAANSPGGGQESCNNDEDCALSSSESWDETGSSYTDGSDDDVPLSAVIRAGSSALVSGPWNAAAPPRQAGNQLLHDDESHDGVPIPDWLKRSAHSPIRSFVPISQQEDSEYFTNQFRHRQSTGGTRKRKKTRGRPRRRKRRKRNNTAKKGPT